MLSAWWGRGDRMCWKSAYANGQFKRTGWYLLLKEETNEVRLFLKKNIALKRNLVWKNQKKKIALNHHVPALLTTLQNAKIHYFLGNNV